jgi:hypothetical protein
MNWRRHTQRVRSFTEDAAQHRSLNQYYAGVKSIPVAAIVGSVGRSHELASDFQSRNRVWGYPQADDRYHSIRAAMLQGIALPAIEVYQLGNQYYVLDGNHRVAAARSVGQLEIDAVVTAFKPVAPATDQAAAA